MTGRAGLVAGALLVLVAVGAGLYADGSFDDFGRLARSDPQAAAQNAPAPDPGRTAPRDADDLAGGPAAAPAVTPAGPPFAPPLEADIPAGAFGDVIRHGLEIFIDTPRAAPGYVGNSLRCVSCHLDAGRLADASPMWAAFVSYPAYRSKTRSVTTFQQRLQGCFEYSMNGRAPPLGAPELVALESYAYWLASGAPLDPAIAGRGYPALAPPAQPAQYARGEQVYTQSCALCHGGQGQGQRTPDGVAVFPALWGPERLRVFPPSPPCTPKHPSSSLQMLAIARAMAALCA